MRVSAAAFVFGFVATNLWALKGEVREEGTNKPIAGAFVVATWSGFGLAPVQGRTRCYHIEFATTDEAGGFRVPEWSGNINPLLIDRLRSIDVYAPGYNKSPKSSRDEGRFLMIRRSGTKEEQFDQVRIASTDSCAIASDPRVIPMYRAFTRELEALATTAKQKRTKIETLWITDTMEFGRQVADRNSGTRFEQLFRDQKAVK